MFLPQEKTMFCAYPNYHNCHIARSYALRDHCHTCDPSIAGLSGTICHVTICGYHITWLGDTQLFDWHAKIVYACNPINWEAEEKRLLELRTSDPAWMSQ